MCASQSVNTSLTMCDSSISYIFLHIVIPKCKPTTSSGTQRKKNSICFKAGGKSGHAGILLHWYTYIQHDASLKVFRG